MIDKKKRQIILIISISFFVLLAVGLTLGLVLRKKENALHSIYIKQLPNRTEYYEGERFDSSGLVVAARYGSKNVEKEVSDYTIEINEPLTLQDTLVTITFSDGNNVKSSTFSISITSTTLTDLRVEKLPQKLDYKTGQILDTSDLKIQAIFNGGAYSQTVTGWTTNVDGKFLAITDTEIEVSYQYKDVTLHTRFEIVLEHRTISSMVLVSPPAKTDYLVGNYFDHYGLKLKVTCKDSLDFEPMGVTILNSDKALTLNDAAITLLYEENGIVVNTQVAITVAEEVQEAEQVITAKKLIALLPDVSRLILADKEAVTCARSAVDQLTPEQQKLVDISKLEELEHTLIVLTEEAANHEYLLQYEANDPRFTDFTHVNPALYQNKTGVFNLISPESEKATELGYEFKYWVTADAYERVTAIENISSDLKLIAVYELTPTTRLIVKDASTNEMIVDGYLIDRKNSSGNYVYRLSDDETLVRTIQTATNKSIVKFETDRISTSLYSSITVLVLLAESKTVTIGTQNSVIVSYEYFDTSHSLIQSAHYEIPVGADVTLQVVDLRIDKILLDGAEIEFDKELRLATFKMTDNCLIELVLKEDDKTAKTISFVLDDFIKTYHFSADWNGKLTSVNLLEISTMFDETNQSFVNTYTIDEAKYFFEDLREKEFVGDSVIKVSRTENRFSLKLTYSGGEYAISGLKGKQTLKAALEDYVKSYPDVRQLVERLPENTLQETLREDLFIRFPDRQAFAVRLYDSENLLSTILIPSQQQTQEYYLSGSLSTPKKLGYHFSGWSKEPGGELCSADYLNIIVQNENADTSLYAVFTINPNYEFPEDDVNYSENFIKVWTATFAWQHNLMDVRLTLKNNGEYHYVIYANGLVNAEIIGEYRYEGGALKIYSVSLMDDYQLIDKDSFVIDIRFCADKLLTASCFYIARSNGEVNVSKFNVVLNDGNSVFANYYGNPMLGDYIWKIGEGSLSIKLSENGTAYIKNSAGSQIVLYRIYAGRVILLDNVFGVMDITDSLQKVSE